MWGTILAVYAVGVSTYCVARSVGITSVADIREKMQAAFQPYKEVLQSHATAAKDNMQLKQQPVMFGQLQEIGQSISRTLGKPETILQSSSELETSAHQ